METTYTYRVFSGVAPNPAVGADPWAGLADYNFGTGTIIMMVWVWDQNAIVRFSYDAENWGDDIELRVAPQAEPFYMSAQKCQIRNKTTGALCNWQIMGQW